MPDSVEEGTIVGMTEHIDFLQLRDFAVSTATRAAELIAARRAELVAGDGIAAHTSTKSSDVDPVTEVDTATEEFIATTIRTQRPGDGIFGEEGANVESTSGVTWIVDPIDGTVNFLYGVPDFAVSIGAEYQGRLVAGAVVNVARGRTYAAAAGQGAMVTGPYGKAHTLHFAHTKNPALALVATGFGYDAQRRAAQAELLTKLLPQVRDIRRIGAAALDLCRVAEGTVDAYFEHGINAWDFAAGAIIAREAGAVVHHPGFEKGSAQGELTWAAGADLAPAFEELLAAHNATGALRG